MADTTLKKEASEPLNPAGRSPGDGAGEPHRLLFLHGMWGGSWVWENFVNFFSERGCPCRAPDLEPDAKALQRPADLSDFLARARSCSADLIRPVLFGHSMGALLAQKLAEQMDATALILTCPAPPAGVLIRPELHHLGFLLKYFPKLAVDTALLPDFEDTKQLALNGLPPETQLRLYRQFTARPSRLLRQILSGQMPVDPARIRCPVLVVAAGQDRTTPPRLAAKIARRYGAEFRVYPEFAHMFPLEPGWERVADDIAGWLERIRPASTSSPPAGQIRRDAAS